MTTLLAILVLALIAAAIVLMAQGGHLLQLRRELREVSAQSAEPEPDAAAEEENLHHRSSLAEMTRTAGLMATSIVESSRAVWLELEGLSRDTMPGGALRLRLERLASESRKLERAARQFLLYTRPAVPHLSRVDLNAAARVCFRALRPSIASTGLRLDFVADPRVGEMQVDPDLFHRMLLELILSAREAAGPSGHVVLRTRHAGEKVVVSVQDDGPAVAPEELGSLFRPFSHTLKRGGGLSLAICRGIAMAHGGEIYAANLEPRGFEVGVKLPLAGTPA